MENIMCKDMDKLDNVLKYDYILRLNPFKFFEMPEIYVTEGFTF